MKNAAGQALFIMLDDSGAPLYRQIYEAIRRFILSGEFAPGRKLPVDARAGGGAERLAYYGGQCLRPAAGRGLPGRQNRRGDIRRRRAAGRSAANRGAEKGGSRAGRARPITSFAIWELLAAKSLSAVREQMTATFQPFQNGLTAVEEFPFETWARLAARWQRNPTRSVLGYGDPQGYRPLREAIAAHLAAARGINAVPEQVVITSGAQQALDLTARIFITPGDTVLTEEPCYLEARGAFEAAGANIIPVPVDGEGIDIAGVPAAGARAKLVYVTPSHQYPLGVTMSLSRRLALIEWARSADAWIIEDDYNSEFRYAGRPLAALQGLDPAGRVIYIGTFSKTIFPSLAARLPGFAGRIGGCFYSSAGFNGRPFIADRPGGARRIYLGGALRPPCSPDANAL